MHVSTRKNLHSHLHQSPLTNQQEVSCFGDNGEGDTGPLPARRPLEPTAGAGDVWVVETANKGVWKRFEQLKLRHADTGKYLVATPNAKFGHPIPGQLEIACSAYPNDPNTNWATAEGFYFPVQTADD
eukprot:TRINITY_DN2351_c0_g1_i1.p2 TRINITY_DN2351_c0_g1~~TRINITY_DN2351_c0_g1_i1.p2  ORF type:complete len:128 (+),score=27.28 TRINITY_DN2351_c0_g1_i1:477-860(+)